MAYSENNKRLIVRLSREQSAERICTLLSKKVSIENGYEFVQSLARSRGLSYDLADWEELIARVPSSKMIRMWQSIMFKELPKIELSKNTKELEHISSLQTTVRSFIDSLALPKHVDDFDEFDRARNLTWLAFKRLIGDAHWPMLVAHIGEAAEDSLMEMAFRLEPEELKETRDHPDEIVIVNSSSTEIADLIHEAYDLVSSCGLDIIAEESDPQVWESHGIHRYCQWCQP
jgi:hypothetical protein